MGLSPVKAGSILAGKYEVEQILGEGGMGVVVAARHVDLDQRVAVKFLLPEVAEHQDAAERFRREARAAVKITSEHVARVIDVGSLDDGIPYMVMEFLQGHDLSEELKTGPLPITEAVGWVLQACEAVAEAHAAGIIHRDLKPANLFLHRKADGTRIVKVLDFGISKSIPGGSLDDLALTSTAALIGSPLYMSPEQMHSAKSVDVRTDIWSLGAIMYQLLAGRPPYVADSLPQLCSALLSDVPPALSGLRKEVPLGLESVVMGALTKDREQRYACVAEFAAALAEFAPNMRVHVDRASRILSGVDTKLASATTNASAAAVVEASAMTADTATLADAAFRDTMASDHPKSDPGASTLASWGKTGDHENGASSSPRRGRVLGAIVAGVVVAGGVVAFGVSRTTAVADSSTAGAELTAPAASAAPVESELAVVPEPAKSEAVAPVNDDADSGAKEDDEAAAKATAKAKAEAEAKAKAEAKKSAPRPAVKRPAAKKPAVKPTSVPSQFGGRR